MKPHNVAIFITGLMQLMLLGFATWLEAQNGGPLDGIGFRGNIGKLFWICAAAITLWGVVDALISYRRAARTPSNKGA